MNEQGEKVPWLFPSPVWRFHFIFITFRTTTTTRTTQGCYCQMIVPALLRGSIDFRHFLGEGECEEGGNLTLYVVFSARVSSFLVTVNWLTFIYSGRCDPM